MKCSNFSLIDIGCAIKDNLDKLDTFVFSNIDIILIENQISPIANRMNCIQGMLSQYFIMKGMNNIRFISAANKLKSFIKDNPKGNYIVTVSKHAFALKDGKLIDNKGEEFRPTRKVDGAYKINKPVSKNVQLNLFQ